MKRAASVLIAALTAGSLVLAAYPATAQGKVQEESGTVIVASPHPQDPDTCFQGTARRISMVTQNLYTGPFFGAIFDVDKATWKGKFRLGLVGGTSGAEDIDIFFYQDFGPGIPDDPSMNSPVILAEYSERDDKGEAGVVPPNSTKALVCLWSGIEAEWEYEAAPAKKKKKK